MWGDVNGRLRGEETVAFVLSDDRISVSGVGSAEEPGALHA
jgi:hypothetical protein